MPSRAAASIPPLRSPAIAKLARLFTRGERERETESRRHAAWPSAACTMMFGLALGSSMGSASATRRPRMEKSSISVRKPRQPMSTTMRKRLYVGFIRALAEALFAPLLSCDLNHCDKK